MIEDNIQNGSERTSLEEHHQNQKDLAKRTLACTRQVQVLSKKSWDEAQ